MSSKIITLKFIAPGLEIKIETQDNIKFSELVDKYCELRKIKKEEFKDKISFELGTTNKKLEWETQETLKELGLQHNSFILVIDQTLKKVRKAERVKKNVVDEQSEKDINETFPEILGDMAKFSQECMDKTMEDKGEGDKYMNYEEALENKNKDKHIFLLGLIGKYLKEAVGAEVFIYGDKKSFTNEERRDGIKTFRYLSNGLITKSKSYIIATINSSKDLNDDKKKNEINQKIKKKLLSIYSQLKENNFVITNICDSERAKFLLIPVIDGDLNLKEIDVDNILKYVGIFQENSSEFDNDLPLMETIILNKSFLTPQHDSKDNSKFGFNEYRGKEKYYPPVGWWRFGVVAYGLYGDDNNWLGYDANNSWCVAYIGLRKREIEDKVKEFVDDDDLRHNGEKVGYGVAVCQNPKDMEEDCEEIENGGEIYKIGFMLRINPEAIRIPKSGNGKYWVVNGTKNELRPYSILSKRIDS